MKKILLSLFVGFVGIISFCNAENIVIDANNLPTNLMLEESINNYEFEFGGIDHVYSNSCKVYVKSVEGYSVCDYVVYGDGTTSTTCDTYSPESSYYPSVNGPFQFQGFGGGCLSYNPNWSLTLSLPGGNSCPEINTGEILSGYILESSIDENYCVSNDLCPVNSGDSASWSELVINDIVHQSAPLININIPQEFDWSYTVDENEFDLGISGYNVDTDYIDGIITAQNSKPNSSDLNKIISELIPLFVPGLVVILFIGFVFKFIKKIFHTLESKVVNQ